LAKGETKKRTGGNREDGGGKGMAGVGVLRNFWGGGGGVFFWVFFWWVGGFLLGGVGLVLGWGKRVF